MLALLYDIHGNLPALEAVLTDADGQGADRWLLGGDMVPFGAWPAETLGRLRDLPHSHWIRGNTERWLVDRTDLAADNPMLEAVEACREMLGDALAQELAALPESAPVDDWGTAWHGSPVSDMRSFLPRPAGDEEELLRGVEDALLVFGHTHLQFRRTAGNGTLLVNPGSVGMPLDGDPRAAYALIHDGGDIELRRVDYDHAASAAELRERFGAPPWVEIVAGRIERATPDA
jgi:diadenosine tetraphosphatase ApaH/serine/threonine PP2A family protein phosphatase